MTRLCSPLPGGEALVGDPVDAVSGANLDSALDARLPGEPPLLWVRHLDSRLASRALPLGHGQTHEYDRALVFDVDGIRYISPVGRSLAFPAIPNDGGEARGHGFILHRVSARLFRLFDAGGLAMEFSVLEEGRPARLTKIRTGSGAIAFVYAANALSSIVDAAGRRVRVASDDAGRVTSLVLEGRERAEDRTLVKYRYDARGDLVEGIDAYGHSFRFAWDEAHRLVRRTDRRGYSFHFEYDATGRCVRSRGEDGLHEVRLEYPSDEITRVTEADGGVWTYAHPERRLTRIVDPLGGVKTFLLDGAGRLAEEVDANGRVTRVLHDRITGARRGRVLPSGRFVAEGETPRRPRAPWCPLHWEYGFLYGELRPGEPIRPPSSDAPSVRRLSATAARWLRTDDSPPGEAGWVVDELGLAIRRVGPGRAERRFTYDASGSLHRAIDTGGAAWTLEHSSWDLRTRLESPAGGAVSIAYTKRQQVASVRDAGGTESRYEYDLAGRLARVTRHGVLKDEYRYDASGALVEKRGGDGAALLEIDVGKHGLPVEKRLASGEVHTFAYDERGRVVAARTPAHETTFRHHRSGALSADLIDGLGVERTFDARGRLASMTYFARFTVQYLRSERRLAIRDPRGGEHVVEAIARGLLFRRMANGSNERSQYDEAGRCLLKLFTTGVKRSQIDAVSYVYSPEGDLLAVEEERRGTERFEYDAAHRLVGWVRPDGRRESFAYDPAGNLLAQPGLSDVSLVGGNRLAQANGERFEYDARNRVSGRTGSAAAATYRYDSQDRLVSVERNGATWEARYDPLGRRIAVRHARPGGEASETLFAWDGDRLAAERDDRGGVRLYIYADGDARTPILVLDYDGLDAAPRSGRSHAVYCDHRGAPRFLVDDAGRVSWSARLSPYGAADVDDGAATRLNLRLPGHYFDEATGLHYNRFRYYAPELGRYLEPDPWGVSGGVNLYAGPSNPLRHVDVRGLCPDGIDDGEKPPDDQEGTKPREEDALLDMLDDDPVEGGRPAAEEVAAPRPSGDEITPVQASEAIPWGVEVVNEGSIHIEGEPDFRNAVKADLDRIAGTEEGRALLGDIADNHEQNGVKVQVGLGPAAGASCGHSTDSNVAEDGTPGTPVNSQVNYMPGDFDESGNRTPNTPSDTVLFHELEHGNRAGSGMSDNREATEPGYSVREEQGVIERENKYREERGLPTRKDHTHIA